MAASRSDMTVLANGEDFQGRVRASMVAAAIIAVNEDRDTAYHRERETYAVQVLNSPDTYKLLFVNCVSTEPTVISAATGAGTVVLTGVNVDTRSALVTDAEVDAAVTLYFNCFFRTPAI